MTRGRLLAVLVGALTVAVVGVIAVVAAPLAGVAIIGVAIAIAGIGAAAVAGVAWAWLAQSNPRVDGEVALPGISAALSIRRDSLGTPYVGASSALDAAFGLGIAMAQDRLWQMDLLRRAAAGRLAEVAGTEAASLDAYARTIGLHRSARRDEESLTGEERDLLEGFAAGVNAVIAGRLGGRPFEFRLLRYAPEPWTVLDSLLIGKAVGWLLSSTLEASLLAWRVTDRIGPELAAMLFDTPPSDVPPAGPEVAEIAAMERGLRGVLGGPATSAGSNVWAVDGRHTRSGKPILANDVHLGNEYSLRFYEARVDAPGLTVSGLFIPGAPLPLAGTNGTVAWGPTNTGVAVSDLYVERLTDDGTATRHGEETDEIVTEVEEIRIRGGETRRQSVRRTRHGPIVSDVVRSSRTEPGTAIALRWSGHELGSPLRALLGIARSTDWESFNAACDAWTVPVTTLGYADADGHIGLRVAGSIPNRPRTGLLPLDGSEAGGEWDGDVAPSAMPRLLDPASGWLASANDVPTYGDAPEGVTWLPEPPYRLRRIRGMLSALVDRGRSLTDVEMALLQRDTTSVQAAEMLPGMIGELDRPALSSLEAEALRHLDDWNANLSVDSVAATIWAAWYQRWLTRVLEERLEPDEVKVALDLPRLNTGHLPWALADRTELDAWCGSATPSELIRASFHEAVGELARSRGRDPSDWDWGTLHTAIWAHPAGRSRVLSWLLNRGPFAVPGDGMTVNAAEFQLAKPYAATLMPVSRLIIDLYAAARPRFSTHPGQSGHPLSPHYDDRLSEFRRGEPHVSPAVLDDAAARHTLRIVPG